MSTSTSRVSLEINLGAIRRNYRKIASHIAPLRVMAVLKANAYGLGVNPIAETLKDEGVHMFGVAEPKEAYAISHLGVPVLILGGLLREEIPKLVKNDILIPIQSLEVANWVQQVAAKLNKTAKCHILIDTGMGRLGILQSEAEANVQQILELPNVQITGIYSHFPTANTDFEFSNNQISQTITLVEKLKDSFPADLHLHISNSDGLQNVPAASKPPFTLVRTGLNLYGSFDLDGHQSLKLEPAIQIKSRLVAVRTLAPGSTVGYGQSCKLEKGTKVGTVSIGYADGLPLRFSGKGYLIVRGVKCPILGQTSMDYTTIDVSNVPNPIVGDEVICLGGSITTADWAKAKGTIPYEVICSIGNRVERVSIDD